MSDQNPSPNSKLVRKSQALPPNPEIPAHTKHLHVSDKTMSEFNKTVETKDAEAIAEVGELIQKLRQIRFWIAPAGYLLLLAIFLPSVVFLWKIFMMERVWLFAALFAVLIAVLVGGSFLIERASKSRHLHWNNLFHRLFTLYKMYAKVREVVDAQLSTFPRLWQAIESAKEKRKKS